jgi:hypothetical protein
MALGVKREWKKRNGGGKDYPGHPETAHMHETYDVIQDCCQLSGYLHPRPATEVFGGQNSLVRNRFAHLPGYPNLLNWFHRIRRINS